jgi:hypothetical protein
MSPVKEPTYFGSAQYFAQHGDARRRRRSALRSFLKRSPKYYSWEEYLELFRDARDQPAVGEASPRYLLLPAAARDMRARVPHARVIFLLRDPAEWLLTRYLKNFWRDPRGSFAQRFREAMQPDHPWAPSLAVGRYATHLRPFFDAFPRKQLQIHLYEDFRADGRAVVRAILRFLEVDPDYPIDLSYRHNPTVVPRFPAVERARQWALRGLPVIQWFPPAARRALRRLYYRGRPPLVMDPADRALVIDYYRDEIRRTADLIGRDLSAWLR